MRDNGGVNWDPNFVPALPSILLSFVWLFVLCYTLPERSAWWRLFRLSSFPLLYTTLVHISFNYDYTLGNPLRDLAMPTITWTVLCKAVEVCIIYSRGGPKTIRPFLPNAEHPVTAMVESDYSKYEWKEVDFAPLCSTERLIYAVDVIGMRRVGTSGVLPQQGRSLEWSKQALNKWAQYLKTRQCAPSEVPVHGPIRRFGQLEFPPIVSLLQFGFLYAGMRWLYALAAPSDPTVCLLGLFVPESFVPHDWLRKLPLAKPCKLASGIPNSVFALPVATRLAMTCVFGAAVCFAAGIGESIGFPLLKRLHPPTGFLSAFDRPLTAPSISRLWARSWHGMSQRDYIHLSSLCPGSENRILYVVYAFMWSGIQHSWMFARLQDPPPTGYDPVTMLRSMFDPGMLTFFLCQAGGILLERAALDAVPVKLKQQHPRAISSLRQLWKVVVLLVPGPAFVDSVLKRDLMTKETLDAFTLSALVKMLQGKRY
ncbi:hypothetical protein BCV70DRAFT_209542 [Testicularia cyperi]|uniref:Wax synthase domain-containing protein n=1 Tax=Testicularia cyperi TaxID=1882483 RepID=A0A317XXW7_9BASI|nr:hypothetical protein BCV70DRAFT_209542 [Testicularia cyperi]